MVRVLRLCPGRAPEVVELQNSLDALQRAVGGHIEVLKAGERLDLVFNEDGGVLPGAMRPFRVAVRMLPHLHLVRADRAERAREGP